MGMRSPADSGNRGLRRGLFHLATALMLNACVLSTGLSGEEAPARVEVILLPEVTVRGPQIRLGDLGVLRGDPALAARAREVIVGQAPLPGREREVALGYIHIRMRQSRLDPEHFNFLAPDRIVVRGAGRTLSPEEQIGAVEAAVRRVCNPREGEELVIEPLSTPVPLTVPEGELQLIADPGEGNAHAASIVAVRLRVLVDGTLAAMASVTVRVRRLSPVWVATRALRYGSILAEDDARVERRDVAGIAQPLPPDSAPVGLRVRRPLSAGSVLTATCLDAAPDVHRGDTITVSLRAGAIRVRVPAKALEEGAAGGEIRVVNLTGGREYRVRVTGPGAAEAILASGE
jgi:flagella basal body P-ring formation protein FlgA